MAADLHSREIELHDVIGTSTARDPLRVHPGSFGLLTELSQHEPDGGEAQEREGFSVQALPVLGETAAPVEPGDGPLDNPALRQDGEALRHVRTLDDLHLDLPHGPLQTALELRPLVATVGVELEQEGMEAKHARHQKHAAVAVLDIGGMDDGVKQEALGVYQDVALPALDLLAAVVARRVDAGPPFSALFTL